MAAIRARSRNPTRSGSSASGPSSPIVVLVILMLSSSSGFVGGEYRRLAFLNHVFRAAQRMRRVHVEHMARHSQSNNMGSATKCCLTVGGKNSLCRCLDESGDVDRVHVGELANAAGNRTIPQSGGLAFRYALRVWSLLICARRIPARVRRRREQRHRKHERGTGRD